MLTVNICNFDRVIQFSLNFVKRDYVRCTGKFSFLQFYALGKRSVMDGVFVSLQNLYFEKFNSHGMTGGGAFGR